MDKDDKLKPRSPESRLEMPSELGLSHQGTQADLRQEAEQPQGGLWHKSRLFLEYQIVLWMWHYIRSRFGKRHRFKDYSDATDDDGIYPLTDGDEPVTVSIAGDWASGTEDAHAVSQAMEIGEPQVTIHLGDVYYVGTKKETLENMFGTDPDVVDGKTYWPPGSRGTFALNANHEMYAKGHAYYRYLLPRIGPRRADGRHRGQHASFFCLRNEHWIIVGLDTGYHSVAKPILEKLFRPSARLDAKLLRWLREDVRIQDDRQRAIILMSHHQYFSAFEKAYEEPARQLSELINRPVLWFWGHEHRLALYGKQRTSSARLEAFGRCVGHGGLPIEDIRDRPDREAGLVVYDARERSKIGDGVAVGYNGFCELRFDGPLLTVEYFDIPLDDYGSRRRPLIRETWEASGGGILRGLDISLVDPAGHLLTRHLDRPLEMALGRNQ